MNVDVTIKKEVFNDIYVPHLDNMARTQIFYGGSASGKSVFLAQRCIYDIINGGRNYLVCRAVGKYVPRSVWMEIQRVIKAWQLEEYFTYRIQAQVIECVNGYQIFFTGLDDTEKLKSIVPKIGAITDIWIEEATETARADIRTLFKRQRGGDEGTPKRLTMSYNPILQSHWIYKEYFESIEWADAQTEYDSDDLTIQKTWYIHNKFLTEGDVEDLESETDKYYYEVYTLGNWGVLGNVIFNNWEVKDLTGLHDQFTDTRIGLDFGYSADPAAITVSHYDSKKKIIYIYDELYEDGLTNPELAKSVKDWLGVWELKDPPMIESQPNACQKCKGVGEECEECGVIIVEHIVADSAEPKSIQELRNEGLSVSGAVKGKDSVNHGVQWLQQHKIIIDKKCINTRNEFMQYKWKEGKDGVPVSPPKPVDSNNHIIDALRYAYESDMRATWVIM